MTSASPARGRPDRQFPGGRAELHDRVRQHGPALSEGRDGFGDDFANQPRVVFIGLGGIALPFIHFPFHNSEIAGA